MEMIIAAAFGDIHGRKEKVKLAEAMEVILSNLAEGCTLRVLHYYYHRKAQSIVAL